MKKLLAILALVATVSCCDNQKSITLLDKANFETNVDGKAV